MLPGERYSALIATMPRRWRWVLVGSIASIAALFVWLLLAGRAAPTAEVSIVPSVMSTSQLDRGAFGPATLVPPPTRAPVARGDDEVELCGGTWVKRGPDGSVDSSVVANAAASPVSQQVMATMRSAADPFQRAAVLMLESRAAVLPSNVPPQDAGLADATAGREALARLAVASDDPRIYALAFRACANSPKEGTCQMLSVEQWARLDPDNVVPWMAVLESASMRKDAATVNEALYRIASAKRSHLSFFDAPGAVLDHAPTDDASLLGTWGLAADMIGVVSAWTLSAYGPLLSSCRGEALRDSNRLQVCTAIADVLAERSDTLLDRSMGAAIGRYVGWPEKRSNLLRGEYLAYVESFAGTGPEKLFPTSCKDIQTQLDAVRRNAALGEVGAMREWLARSGRQPEEFLALGRASQERREHAEQARVAASPASTQ